MNHRASVHLLHIGSLHGSRPIAFRRVGDGQVQHFTCPERVLEFTGS